MSALVIRPVKMHLDAYMKLIRQANRGTDMTPEAAHQVKQIFYSGASAAIATMIDGLNAGDAGIIDLLNADIDAHEAETKK